MRGMYMNVQIRPRVGRGGPPGTRVEVDWQVPGVGLGRKVYLAPPDRPFKMSSPHQHNSGHLLVCMSGQAVLAYRKADGSLVWEVLEEGGIYWIPPGVPHQLRIEPGGILATYFPPQTWMNPEVGLKKFDEDWFG